jgi:FMN-dependent NADH-azoreductase
MHKEFFYTRNPDDILRIGRKQKIFGKNGTAYAEMLALIDNLGNAWINTHFDTFARGETDNIYIPDEKQKPDRAETLAAIDKISIKVGK